MVQVIVCLPKNHDINSLSVNDKRRVTELQHKIQANTTVMRDNVVIKGLQNSTHLNGHLATVVHRDADTGPHTRYNLVLAATSGLLKADKRFFRVKANNLMPAPFVSIVVCSDEGVLRSTGLKYDLLFFLFTDAYDGEQEQAKHDARTAAGTDMFVLYPNGPSIDRQTYRTFWEGAIVPTTLPPVQSMLITSVPSGLSEEGLDRHTARVLHLASTFANATPDDMGAAGAAGGSQA